ncbi:MAG TPA: SpoIIE family protein phosphatase [bacterium]|nr:SpoIIE family protein phosphatase [bacterium]
MSILAKYSLWLLGILLLAAGFITAASLVYQRDALTKEAMLRGESIALNLAAPAAEAFLSHDALSQVNLAASATRDNQGVVYAALLDARGNVVGHPDPKAMLKPLAFEPTGDVPGLVTKATVRSGAYDGVAVWDVSVPVRVAGSRSDLGSAHVGLARSVVEGAVRQSLEGLGLISALILVVGVGLTFLSLRVLVRPLHELSLASEAVGKGDLGISVPVRSEDEIGRLAGNFNAMIKGLKQAEAAKIEQGRIEGELELARSIQSDLLPARPPFIAGLNVAFHCLPAKELGGDFYDCIELKGGLWGFLIADVSGKGVPAALHMANLRNLFRIFGPPTGSPLEALKQVNAMAYADMKAESFVTLIYAVVDPKTLQVRMVNAGHDPAYWVNQGKIQAFESTAPPVGLAPSGDYDPEAKELTFKMEKGDMLFTFTDGVTEAMNGAGEQFSLERLKASLLQGGDAGAATQRLLGAVQSHAGGADQSDDITMLAVRAA